MMDGVLIGARVLLAGVFLASGLAKLLDQEGTREGLTEFGLPISLSAPLAVVLPAGELGLSVGFLMTSTAWWTAMLALAMLLSFTVASATNLAKGRRPICHCFGQVPCDSGGDVTHVSGKPS